MNAVDAIWYVRKRYLGRKLSWREVGELFTAYSGKYVPGSEAWNVAHKKYRCPRHISLALERMGLMRKSKRYRFFYEVDEKRYQQVKGLLDRMDITFTKFMSGYPWDLLEALEKIHADEIRIAKAKGLQERG